ncbi:MAG: PQQ-dependent sugar dehydrogenase [bacterium]|nr:PQQ-dependent sugar dehydrogenase [bacterium]
MKKITLTLASVLFIALAARIGVFYWHNLRGISPVLKSPPEDIAKLITEYPAGKNETSFPLALPPGFSIEIFAKNLPGVRVMAFDQEGNMWVSRTGEGAITFLRVENGSVTHQDDAVTGLRNPHGLAFDPADSSQQYLYFAEEHQVSRLRLGADGPDVLEKTAALPSGDGHFTRTIGFGPDNQLYVSIGSSCNVCIEKDQRRAAIYVMEKDGSDFRQFARGLRNAVFFVWHQETKKMWVTEMGRDLIGDNIPPDEINIVEEGKNYGWPNCYGKNIHDTDFDHNTYIRNPCMEPFETESFIDLPAHSAPLGLAFVPSDAGWPKDYAGNLLVAYHGSWNRTRPTGYKVVRMKFDKARAYKNMEDFISGWLTAQNEALGRPVDLVFGPDHALYVSDDKAGVIYRIAPPQVR